MSRRKYQSFKSGTTLNVCHPESPRFASRAEGSQSPKRPRVSLWAFYPPRANRQERENPVSAP